MQRDLNFGCDHVSRADHRTMGEMPCSAFIFLFVGEQGGPAYALSKQDAAPAAERATAARVAAIKRGTIVSEPAIISWPAYLHSRARRRAGRRSRRRSRTTVCERQKLPGLRDAILT